MSMFSSFLVETSFKVHAETDTFGKEPEWAKKSFEEADKDNAKSTEILKKQSDEFSKTHDKNIEYDLDGSIPKDPNNVDVAKRYKKELPKLEKQLKDLNKDSKQYKSLRHKVSMHRTVIKAIFG